MLSNWNSSSTQFSSCSFSVSLFWPIPFDQTPPQVLDIPNHLPSPSKQVYHKAIYRSWYFMGQTHYPSQSWVFKSGASLSKLDNTVNNTSSIQSTLNSLQNGECFFVFATLLKHTITRAISTRILFLYFSQFSTPYSTLTCSKIILTSLRTFPSSIDQQFLTYLFLLITTATIYTTNVFSTSVI